MPSKSIPSVLDLQHFYPEDLKITDIKEYEKELHIFLRSRTESYVCPECGQILNDYHATHHRKVQDLPILGKRVILDIDIHEFDCHNDGCGIRSVSETFDGFLSYRSRMTDRLSDFIITLALETSCESCARIMQASNVKVSGDTVIRMLLKRFSAQPRPECGETIGIDDFSFKKRDRYGTVIVDEKTHETIALLDGRDGIGLKEWLKENQHVTTVTRDRASAYAKAVEEVLPSCMQVADRFHLHQNLLDAVRKILSREIPASVSIPVHTDDGTDGISSDDVNEASGPDGQPDSNVNECKKNAIRCG